MTDARHLAEQARKIAGQVLDLDMDGRPAEQVEDDVTAIVLLALAAAGDREARLREALKEILYVAQRDSATHPYFAAGVEPVVDLARAALTPEPAHD
jgi:hypothetical protein